MKKILCVFGTRPEAIKMAPIITKLKSENTLESKVCISGQHREMLDCVLSVFDISADYDLSIMKNEQTLSYITSSVMQGIEKVIFEYRPDFILVHGDTSTAFAACMAAFYNKIPVAHIEAGLRSGNMGSPFPEEFNRRSISLMSSLHFAPTISARKNLLNEGIDDSSIFVTGNTVIDSLLLTENKISHLALPSSKFILMTVHRREHSDEDISAIFRAVRRICIGNPSLYVIYPVHKNPRLLRLSTQILYNLPNIILTEPMTIIDFHHALRKCYLVLTDSGGVQEEASYLGKPVVVVRNSTERHEGAATGTLKLVGNNEESVYSSLYMLISDKSEYSASSIKCTEFGDGHAAERIIDILKKV